VTLAEIIPSLRSSLPRRLEPGLWPSAAHHLPGGDVSVGGASLVEVAARYGTPAVVVDVAEFRGRCAGLRRVFGDIDICHSGGMLLAADTASVVQEQGLRLGIYCEAQLATTVAAAFPADRLVVYGDAGRTSLLRAMSIGAGQIVLASMGEIEVAARLGNPSRPQPVSLSIGTGTVDGVSDLSTHRRASRGFSIDSGEAAEAVRRILASPGLRLVGVQCRVDAPFATVAPYEQAGREGLEFVRAMRDENRVELSELHLGGGHNTPVQPGDDRSASCEVAARLRRGIAQVCTELLLPAPHVTIEPGRSLAGPAALTICRVLAVRRFGERTIVEVDARTGGVATAARQHAARAAHLLSRLSPSPDVHVEVIASGSLGANSTRGVLVRDTLLPADIAEGDLLAVPSIGDTGGFALAHRLPCPALVAVADNRSWSLAAHRGAQDAQRRRRVS